MATTAPITLPSIYKNIAAPAGANPADVQATKDQMAMTYEPQESSITNVINTLQSNLGNDIAGQQQYGQIADQKIAGVGAQLAQQLQGNVGAIGNIYQQGQQNVGGAYDTGSKEVGAAGQSIMDRLSQAAGNLGQQQSLKADPYGADPISRLMAQQASAQTNLASTKAAKTSNLASLGTALQGIAQKAVGDSESNYAQKRADVATQVLKTIGQLQTTTNASVMDQLQKFSDLAATEGPAFRTLLNQATTARTQAERQNALDAFDQWYKTSQLGISQQRADAATAKSAAANDPNSLDNIIKQQTIDKNNAALNAPNYATDAEGMNNLQTFLDQTRRSDRGQPGLSGTQVAGIQNWINQNIPQASMGGIYNTADPEKILDSLAASQVKNGLIQLPGAGTKNAAGKSYGKAGYTIDLPTLANAIAARFLNVGTSAKAGTRIK